MEDPETEQTLVSGMGELHLHITLDRIQRQYKLPDAKLGKMSVAFRETISIGGGGVGKAEEDQVIGTKRRFCKLKFQITKLMHPENEEDVVMHNEIDLSAVNGMKQGIDVDQNKIEDGTSTQLKLGQLEALKESITAMLESYGPIAGYPVTGVRVSLDLNGCAFDDDSTPAAITSCAKRAVKRALENSNVVLLEPVMELIVTAPSKHVGSVVADVSSSSRRGFITDVGGQDEAEEQSRGAGSMTNIKSHVPLREMVGYSTDLRSLTSGEANFTMSLLGYKEVLSQNVVKEISEEKEKDLPKTIHVASEDD